jgi:hypothetical protein
MTLLATWLRAGTHAEIRDEADELWARLHLMDDWYPEGSRTPVRAWTVEWLDRSGADSEMVRTRLDVAAEPAVDEDEMARLSTIAAEVARGAIPEEPLPFGHANTGLAEGGDSHRRVVLTSHAIQEASGRLREAAQCEEEWGADRVLIALTEALGWVRALDDAMSHIWRARRQPAFAPITERIDRVLEGPGLDPSFVAWAKSRRKSDGYDDWTIGLLIRSAGLSREELRGARWLAGKMLHFGPLPATELRNWRAGESPRWKWRQAADIFPETRGERRSEDRVAYDRYLAGRDLIGSFNLFNALLAAECLAHDLTGTADE